MSAGNIKVELNYNRDNGIRPFKFGRPRTQKEQMIFHADEGGPRKFVPSLVRNARNGNFSLDKNSFELIKDQTSLSTNDFYNTQLIEKVYYKEVAESIKNATGASAVQIYHHQVRNPEKNNGSATNVNTSVQGYADRIHLDTDPLGCIETFKHFTDVIGIDSLKQGRFVVLNAWRNISNIPVQKNHLAVLDEQSTVKPDDYLTGDFYGNKNGTDYTVSQYLLNSTNAKQHRWYYYPKMTKDELLLFKMFDSDTSNPGRYCFHTAFSDPEIPSDVPCRQSIEVRAFVYFPDYVPNTCPDINEGILVPEKVFPYKSGGILF